MNIFNIKKTHCVHFEQAVYGSFPFWDKGYSLLAQSPGCRPEWLAELKAVCQRFGERPMGTAEADALFAMRIAKGPWMVVGVSGQGDDDRGRPGALAFHALFLSPREYRKARFNPFALSGALRRDWGPETRALAAESWEVENLEPPVEPIDDRAWRIAAALTRRHRIAIESPEPIDELARAVVSRLPERVRRRISIATWAFANGNRFDLVALPRLAGMTCDASYREESMLEAAPAAPRETCGRWARIALGAVAFGAGALIGLLTLETRPDSARPATTAAEPKGPDRAAYRENLPDPEEQARVTEALLDLAERFRVLKADSPTPHATALMIQIADRLRYRGPLLTTAEQAQLQAEPTPDRDQARAWDEQIRRFLPDRPLPADFARGPLRWQLDTLAWSFHLATDPRLSTAEVPLHLADRLAVEGPIRPSPLAGRYPALTSYTQFLERLPRR
jgi:hypothetical protein